MLKTVFTTTFICASLLSFAQQPKLDLHWETDSTFKVPESVLYSTKEKVLYVSNINGKSDEKDLKGSITRMSTDGKTITHDWAINLSAPKGMGIYQNSLYVADLDEVVIIDLSNGKVSDRIPVKDAVFLNDISITGDGVVYVSDSRSNKIHRIQNKEVTTWFEDKANVNGLLAVGTDLYFVSKGSLFKSDINKEVTLIASGMDESTDGIVQTNNNNFIVSCWNGIIYHINQKGEKQVLLDTRAQQSNTADIGYNPDAGVVYVPTFLKNKVVAYKLK